MATNQEIIDSLKTDWKPTDYYDFASLNRVEKATEIVRDKIAELRGEVIQLIPVDIGRTNKDFVFADDLNRIEENIKRLADSFEYGLTELRDLRTDWTFNEPFSFDDANRYEANLKLMYENIESNISNFYYCGQYTLTTLEGVL